MSKGFLKTLDDFADYRDISRREIKSATVSVTERYARRVLKLKKDAPLEYRGLALKCIGSERWRAIDANHKRWLKGSSGARA